MANPSRPKKRKRQHRRDGSNEQQPSKDNEETRTASEPKDTDTSSASETAHNFLRSGATVNPLTSSSSSSQQQHPQNQKRHQQQMPQTNAAAPQLDWLSTMPVPMQAQAAPLANWQSQPQGAADTQRMGTGGPLHPNIVTQPPGPLIASIQDGSHLSTSLLVGIQQLLQQLSSNLEQRGLDARTDINTGIPAPQPVVQWPPPPQHGTDASNNSNGLQQVSSNAMQAVAAALAYPPPVASAALHEATTPTIPPHPPIHPGAATGEAQRTQQDYTTIPCRARGMPPDHNSQAAYFVVPNKVKHGENLICTYTECAAQGVKFCFCVYCGIPVAKRNFRQRHDHGQKKARQVHPSELTATNIASAMANPKEALDELVPAHRPAASPSAPPSGLEPCKPGAALAATSPGKQKPGLKVAPDDDDDEREESFSTHSSSTSSISQRRSYGQDHHAQMDPAADDLGSAEHRTSFVQRQQGGKVWTPGTVSEERKQRWSSLLYDRPEERNEDGMSHWLLSVLQVSDPATSVPSMSSSNGANESGGAANTGSGSTNTNTNGSSSNLGSSTGTSRGAEDGSAEGSGDTGSGESREQSSSSSHTSDETSSNQNARQKVAIVEASTPNSKRARKQGSPDQEA